MSASTAKALDIAIMGRTYKVSCQEEERESLLEAVAYLDRKMGEIKSGGRVGNAERIAVMAALNITHEYLEVRRRNESLTSDLGEGIARIQGKIAKVLGRGNGSLELSKATGGH